MDGCDDRISVGDGKSAAGAEIVLDVDDKENVSGSDGDQAGLQGATGIDYGSRSVRVYASLGHL